MLVICATPSPGRPEALARRCAEVELTGLAELAEEEGLAALALDHLRAAGVEHAELRRLKAYAMRAELDATKRERVLREVLALLSGTPVVLLKGAALSRLVYTRAAHRPMADLDLWVPPEAVADCRAKLARAGFDGPPAGGEYERVHHTAAIGKDGVWIELHRSFLGGGRAERWDEVFPRAVEVDGAFVPCRAHLLWQVWHHAFRSSLRWTPWRLVWVADLVGLLEGGDLDWDWLGPMPGLASLHALTPLSDGVLRALGGVPELRGAGAHHRGWPRSGAWPFHAPTPWWLRLRHGIRGQPLWRCRLEHLRDLWHEHVARDTGPPPPRWV